MRTWLASLLTVAQFLNAVLVSPQLLQMLLRQQLVLCKHCKKLLRSASNEVLAGLPTVPQLRSAVLVCTNRRWLIGDCVLHGGLGRLVDTVI